MRATRQPKSEKKEEEKTETRTELKEQRARTGADLIGMVTKSITHNVLHCARTAWLGSKCDKNIIDKNSLAFSI